MLLLSFNKNFEKEALQRHSQFVFRNHFKMAKTSQNQNKRSVKIKPKAIPKSKTITQFFNKKVKNSGNGNDLNGDFLDANKKDTATEFYETCLEAKLKMCEAEKNCHSVKKSLQDELALAKQKLEKIEKASAVCLEICNKKDKEIQLLKGELQSHSNEENDPEMVSASVAAEATNRTLFQNSSNLLAEHQLSKLQSIGKTKSGDSTFILNGLRSMCSDNLPKLLNKTVGGCSKLNATAECISPDKMQHLKSLYTERILDLNLPEAEKIEREKNLSRHLHRAITNINKKTKKENEKLLIE